MNNTGETGCVPNRDAEILAHIVDLCAGGDLVTLWAHNTLQDLACLTKPALQAAKRMVRLRFGRDCAPILWCSAIAAERQSLFSRLRAESFSVTGSHSTPTVTCEKRDSLASIFGRRGGLVLCKKGLASMSPEKKAEIRALALDGRNRARAVREQAARNQIVRSLEHTVGHRETVAGRETIAEPTNSF
jgi:hypothetical protein